MSANSDQPDSTNPSPFLSPSSRIDIEQRHLPHWQLDGGFYFVTWRTADSLPQAKLQGWLDEKRDWVKAHPEPWCEALRKEYRERFPARIEAWLDAGYGACVLRDPRCGQIVADALLHFDRDRYDMATFVVMPNHVHALFQLRGAHKLKSVLGSWKSYSALQLNRQIDQDGALWQQENWDYLLRGAADLQRCFYYIKKNPKKAGLLPGEYIYYERPDFLPEVWK